MIEIQPQENPGSPKILVVGVGGGGNNAINRMIEANLNGVVFAIVNTDAAVLYESPAEKKIQIGEKLLKGFGAGADPDLGEAAAQESLEDIRDLVQEYKMVIITCGMGGGTGTGAAPIIAKCCKEAEVLTMGVVTTPFSFEARPRTLAAKSGVEKLKENVDTLLVIPNDKLLTFTERQIDLQSAFEIADSVLRYTIEGITNIVYNLGTINIDFNDLRTTLVNKGLGHLGIGIVDSDGSVMEAVKQAVNSPLLETSIAGAENILLNTSGKIFLPDLSEACQYIRELAGENVSIIWGTVKDETVGDDKITVTLIATGMPENDSDTSNKLPYSKKPTSPSTQTTSIKEIPIERKGFIPIEKPKPKEEMHVQIPVFLKEYSSK